MRCKLLSHSLFRYFDTRQQPWGIAPWGLLLDGAECDQSPQVLHDHLLDSSLRTGSVIVAQPRRPRYRSRMPFRHLESLRRDVRRITVAGLCAAVGALSPVTLPAQAIAGRVTDDRTLQPAIDYAVRLVQVSDSGPKVLAETATDPKGQFTVVAPSAGNYVLSFGRTAPRVYRVPVAVEAGVAPAAKEFALPIQRDADARPYMDVDVDSALVPHTRSVSVRYPDAKRVAQEGGSLFAMFVVDTSGHVESNSVRLFSGTHADFTAAADEWMSKAWFRPPSVGGVAVRRQVCMPMVFVPQDKGRPKAAVTPPALPAAGLAQSARALCSRAIAKNDMLTIRVVNE